MAITDEQEQQIKTYVEDMLGAHLEGFLGNFFGVLLGSKKITLHTEVGYTDKMQPNNPTGYTTTIEVE